jgi:hypothetical protein
MCFGQVDLVEDGHSAGTQHAGDMAQRIRGAAIGRRPVLRHRG